MITFDFFRRALIALAESIEAVVGTVRSNSLIDLWPQEQSMPLPLAWISYLAPAYTSLVAPPPRAIVEHRPDGGLLMNATPDTFMTNNAGHLAVAREIEAAVAPFNALPWPQTRCSFEGLSMSPAFSPRASRSGRTAQTRPCNPIGYRHIGCTEVA